MPAPPHDLAALAAWPEAFTRYFADHFAFRSRLVRWQARVRVGLLEHVPGARRDAWRRRLVVLRQRRRGRGLHRHARPFTATELERWRSTLQHTQDWLERRGIDYVFVLAPDKHWIYPDRMPAGFNRPVDPPRSISSSTTFAPFRPSTSSTRATGLAASASGERLYHLTDTHWNDRGAFVAYQQVMARIGPPLAPAARTPDDMEARVIPRSGFDLARMLGLGGVLVEEDLQLEPRGGRARRG